MVLMKIRSLPNEWDVIVAGGGAAGLSAALLLGRARRKVLVIDSGEPRNRYASHMHGVLGNEGTPPGELLRTGREEIRLYGGRVINPTVESVSDCDGGVKVILADGSTYIARALIGATGVSDTLPLVPGLQERWGGAVFHCPYCHGWEVKDQHIGVLATSPASLHHAQLARQWSDQVTVFTANLGPLDPDEEKKLRSRGIRLVSAKVTHVVGQGNTIDFVRTSTGQEIDLDAILVAAQTIPRDEFLDGLALSRTELPLSICSVLEVDATGKTSHPRIWAIGNVVPPFANVPMSVGAGAFTGSAVNGVLVNEDFSRAMGTYHD